MSQQPPLNYQLPPGPLGSNGLAVASLVCGIISCVIFCVWFIALPLAIVAIVLGALATSKAKQGAGGGGMARAGVILGVIGVVLPTLLYILLFAGCSIAGRSFRNAAQQMQKQLEAEQQRLEKEQWERQNSTSQPASGDATTQPGAMLLWGPGQILPAPGWWRGPAEV